MIINEIVTKLKYLQGAFSRTKTFHVFCMIVLGFTMGEKIIGVSSIINVLGIRHSYYYSCLYFFRSKAINLEKLIELWTSLVFNLFSKYATKINGRILQIGDGVNVPKAGKKMPGVKSLHQSSENNTKPKYIMGHFFQSLCFAVECFGKRFATPITIRLHDGVKYTNNDKRKALDKMLLLLNNPRLKSRG